MDKKEYKRMNEEWLARKCAEPDVRTLEKGVCYKVVANGDASSRTPDPSSVVTVHYEGRTIDGRVFDSSRGDVPPAFRLRDLIPGWIIALQRMHAGDRFEIYIPAALAYGKYAQPGIPANSTLIFDIELLAVN